MLDNGRVPLITGIVLAILVAGILVSSPATFVGRGATFIDTEAWTATGGGVPVSTTQYLRSPTDIEEFPAAFDGWNMTADYSAEWGRVKTLFRAEVVVSRYYSARGIFLPIHLFIIDSQYTRVLHSLPASYGLQGFEPESRETVHLEVGNDTWLSSDSPNRRVPVVEMTFVKRNASTGDVEERRLVHFFWVKREAWGVTNHLTWVGTNLLVPPTGDMGPHVRLLSNFTGDVVARLFVPEASDVKQTVAHALWDDRPLGPVVVAGATAVPLGLVGYGIAIGRRRPGA